jgi:predicted RNA binding protein YcfA (HicA-like mRNA interferase family)
MSRLPLVNPKQMIRALTRAGFVPEPETGSAHLVLRHPVSGRKTVVSRHAGDLKRGTTRAILKQAGLTVEQFQQLL